LTDPQQGGRAPAAPPHPSRAPHPGYGLFRRFGPGDDGRFDRARISYWIIFQKFPFAGARRIRDAVALAAVSFLLGALGALADRFDPRR